MKESLQPHCLPHLLRPPSPPHPVWLSTSQVTRLQLLSRNSVRKVTNDMILKTIFSSLCQGVGSMTSTQPTTPSTTPAYPPNIGLPLAGGPNLGVIPEHLAEGMNNIFRVGAGGSPSRGGADSGGICLKIPCGNTETPLSISRSRQWKRTMHTNTNSILPITSSGRFEMIQCDVTMKKAFVADKLVSEY